MKRVRKLQADERRRLARVDAERPSPLAADALGSARACVAVIERGVQKSDCEASQLLQRWCTLVHSAEPESVTLHACNGGVRWQRPQRAHQKADSGRV